MHWSKKGGNHKAHCRPTGQLLLAPPAPPSLHDDGDDDGSGDECNICLSSAGQVVQRGCACRGDVGWVHLECMVQLANHDDPKPTTDSLDVWRRCKTCKQEFTGSIQLGLARALTGQLTSPQAQARALAEPEGTRAKAEAFCALLSATCNLAIAYADHGDYAQAEVLELTALEHERLVLGKDHQSTLETAGNLVATRLQQGKHAEAEMLMLETLPVQKRVLGPTHPYTLRMCSHQAMCYTARGKYSEAEVIMTETMAIQKEVLGEAHPHRLMCAYNLALIYTEQGKHAEAEALLRETLVIQMRVLGHAHPGTRKTSVLLDSCRSRQATTQGKPE